MKGFQFSFAVNIATTDATITLQADPGDDRTLVVQSLTVTITTAAAQAFDIEGVAGTVELFKAPVSLAVGTWAFDFGPIGIRLASSEALQYVPAAAGVGATLSGFGYITKDAL